MRSFLARAAALRKDCIVVDLCTGTGSSALRMALDGARVIGIDLSEGMLHRAQHKSSRESEVHWVQAYADVLPISSASVDRVTCSYGMYELNGSERYAVLKEALRILKPGGMFIMMEHLPPNQSFIKLLYFARIYLLGTKGVRAFAGSEEKELSRFFVTVKTVIGPGARTKVVLGHKRTKPGIHNASDLHH